MKKILAVISAVLVLLAVSSLVTGCGESARSYEKGCDAAEAGDYGEAVAKYRLALSQGCRNEALYADLACALLKGGDPASAEEAALHVDQTSEDPEVQIRLGNYYEAAGKTEEAETCYLRVIESGNGTEKDTRYAAMGYLAGIKMDLGEYMEAVSYYNELITAGYHVPEHLILAGQCYVEETQFYAGCQYFSILEERKDALPGHFAAVYRILREADDDKDAEHYFEAGLALIENSKKKTMTEGEYYWICGRLKKAEALLETGDSLNAMLLRAASLTENGEFEEAESIYQELILKDEETAKVYCRYMEMKIRQGEYDAALQLLTQIRVLGDQTAISDAAWNEVILYELKLDYDTAYDKLLEYSRNYPMTEDAERELAFLSAVKK